MTACRLVIDIIKWYHLGREHVSITQLGIWPLLDIPPKKTLCRGGKMMRSMTVYKKL